MSAILPNKILIEKNANFGKIRPLYMIVSPAIGA